MSHNDDKACMPHENWRFILVFVAVWAVSMLFSVSSPAQTLDQCNGIITRNRLVHCAENASLTLRSEVAATDAIRGRHVATRPWLPSNPVLSLTASRPTIPEQGRSTSLNWYAAISQELELGGQRGARREATAEAVTAQNARLKLTARDVAATAWVAWYDALAAQSSLELARAVEAAATRVLEVTSARVDQHLTAAVEADLANAEKLRAVHTRAAAQRKLQAQLALVTTMMGGDPALAKVSVEGDLQPLANSETLARKSLTDAVEHRPEVQALQAERRAYAATAESFRRARIPNPTLSVFAQRDDISGQTLGLGLAFPIPLPEPVGRLHVGEIASNEASERRAANDAERARRQIRLDTVVALHEYESLREEARAFDSARLLRARQFLADLSDEVRGGRLTVRDAIVTQQSLIALLEAHIEARRALCVASVDLARAAGVALEAGEP